MYSPPVIFLCDGFQLLFFCKNNSFKEIVSRNFEVLQMILMDRTVVYDVPLDVNLFFYFLFSYSIYVQSFERVKLLLMHLAKA